MLPLEERGHGPLSAIMVPACPWIPCGVLGDSAPLLLKERPKSAMHSPQRVQSLGPASLIVLQTKVGTGEADAPTRVPAAVRERDPIQIKQR